MTRPQVSSPPSNSSSNDQSGILGCFDLAAVLEDILLLAEEVNDTVTRALPCE